MSGSASRDCPHFAQLKRIIVGESLPSFMLLILPMHREPHKFSHLISHQ